MNRSHKPNATESAQFLTNAQDDYFALFGTTPSDSDKTQNKLVMLYYLVYVLQWYAGEAGYLEAQSPPQGGSQSLPSMAWVNKQIAMYEELTIGGVRSTSTFSTSNELSDNGYADR